MLLEQNGDNLTTAEQKVAWILERVPAARSSYMMLLITYWVVHDNISIPDEVVEKLLIDATKPETITRVRRKVIKMKRHLKSIQEVLDSCQKEKKSG